MLGDERAYPSERVEGNCPLKQPLVPAITLGRAPKRLILSLLKLGLRLLSARYLLFQQPEEAPAFCAGASWGPT